MNITQIIEEQSKDENMPLGVITITGGTGSFDLPENIRLVLRDCNGATCNSHDGGGELTVINCDDFEVKDFQKGILRLERCNSIGKISTSGQTTLHLSSTKIQELDLQDTELVLMEAQAQKVMLEKCIVTSIQNTYQGEVTINGGTFTSHKDTFQDKLSTDENTQLALIEPTAQGKVQFSTSSITVQKGTFQDEVTIEDSPYTDNESTYQDKVTISGDKSVVVFRSAKLQDELNCSDANTLNAVDLQAKGKVTLESGSYILRDLSAEDDVSITGASAIVQSGECKAKFTADNSALKLRDCSFQDDVSITGGSVSSDTNEYQGKCSFESTTLESAFDKFQDELTCESLLHHSAIWKPDGNILKCTISGDSASSSIKLDQLQAEEFTCTDFGNATIRVLTATKCTIQDNHYAHMLDATCTQMTVTDSSTVLLNSVTSTNATITGVCTLITDDCELTTLILDDTTNALLAGSTITTATLSSVAFATTDGISTLSITECAHVLDRESTIANCTASGITGYGSQIVGDTSLVQLHGGTADMTDSLVLATAAEVNTIGNSAVLANGSTVINPDGLTVGTGFEPMLQAGCLLQDGTQTVLQSTVGDLTLVATTGNITMTALQSVTATAGTDVLATAGGIIYMQSTLATTIASGASLTCVAVSDASFNGTTVLVSGAAVAALESAGNTAIRGSLITLN